MMNCAGRPSTIVRLARDVAPGTNGLNPLALGASAMSQPAWDVKRKSIWYTDGKSGFYVL